MIVQAGLAEIIEDIADIMASAIVSSDSTDPAYSDTDIAGAIATVAITDVVQSNTSLTFQGVINSITANGSTIKKIAVKTTDGTLFSNDNHPDLAKTSSDEVRYFFKLTVKRGGT